MNGLSSRYAGNEVREKRLDWINSRHVRPEQSNKKLKNPSFAFLRPPPPVLQFKRARPLIEVGRAD